MSDDEKEYTQSELPRGLTHCVWFQQSHDFGRSARIMVGAYDEINLEHEFVARMVYTKRSEATPLPHDAGVSLGHGDLRRLMDSMWSSGVRPTDWNSEGQAKAMQAHIDTLQGIVDKLMTEPAFEPDDSREVPPMSITGFGDG